MMHRNSSLITPLCLMLFLTFDLMAQPGGGGPGDPTPIDGGLGILLVVAAAYGGKKTYDKRNNR